MNEKEIIAGNILIERFLGSKVRPDLSSKSFKKSGHCHLERPDGRFITTDRLYYNSSWSDLMLVLEEIKKMPHFHYQIGYIGSAVNICIIQDYNKLEETDIRRSGKTQIEACWRTVIAFIEWYIKNKKK